MVMLSTPPSRASLTLDNSASDTIKINISRQFKRVYLGVKKIMQSGRINRAFQLHSWEALTAVIMSLSLILAYLCNWEVECHSISEETGFSFC